MKEFAIILNGDNLCPEELSGKRIICADGGYRLCKNVGLTPETVIGDFDSFDVGEIPRDIPTVKHDARKNLTDGELCLIYALEHDAEKVTFLGGFGGRADHQLGNLGLLIASARSGVAASMTNGNLAVEYLTESASRKSVVGSTVSILPISSITVKGSYGLAYPLCNLTLTPLCSRGISNVVTGDSDGTFGIEFDKTDPDKGLFVFYRKP